MLHRKDLSFFAVLVACLALGIPCVAQSGPDHGDADKMVARIDSIVNKAAIPLQLSEPSAPVRITSSQIFFESDDVLEIQKYGAKAVPGLSKFLLNKNARIERAAIRLLGMIGGPGIVDPLLDVIEKSPNSMSRTEALLNLQQAPCSKAVARAILRVANSDPDSTVREQARTDLSWCPN
jgi:hypothetical protein